MHRTSLATPALLSLSALLAAGAGACGDDAPDTIDPADVRFGVTALVVMINPPINAGSRGPLPAPGTARAGIMVADQDGPAAATDENGIAVLAPMPSGVRTILVTGGGIGGSFDVLIGPGSLREAAVAAEGERVEIMTTLDYAPDRIMELSPALTAAQVNDELHVNDRIVFLTGGVYTGDLDLTGRRVTLFGEGVFGDKVTIQGNVKLSADSRIRGVHITGTLTMPANSSGLILSRVDGGTTVTGTDALVLQNALCGGATITGPGVFALGNRGVAPTPACP
jgi:hypothetical protein